MPEEGAFVASLRAEKRGGQEADYRGWSFDRLLAVTSLNVASAARFEQIQLNSKKKLDPPKPIKTPLDETGESSAQANAFAVMLAQARRNHEQKGE